MHIFGCRCFPRGRREPQFVQGPFGRTSHGAPCARPAGVGLILADILGFRPGSTRRGVDQ
eukprot:10073077-Lingulodinium_polyedra.AAC.1